MTATVTELEIIEALDFEAEIPCESPVHKALSTQAAKYLIRNRCPQCKNEHTAYCCDPCYVFWVTLPVALCLNTGGCSYVGRGDTFITILQVLK